MTEGLRPVRSMPLPGVEMAAEVGPLPVVELVDPATLLVDDAYQRHLSERSMSLVRKIAGGWDWRRFKPPVVTRVGDSLRIIDGQHTATAAASHPAIPLIPVIVVVTESLEDQASAFVGQNRDRLQLTPTQLHHAAVAAGDPEATAVNLACSEAGVTMIKSMPGNGVFKPCETMAVSSIATLIRKWGRERAVAILQVLAAASLAPISAGQIKAVELLLTEDEYAGVLEPADLTSTLIKLGPDAERQAAIFAATHKLQKWRALAIVLFRSTRHVRRRKD